MRPLSDQISPELPGIPPEHVSAALDSLPQAYFDLFPTAVQLEHLQIAFGLDHHRPARILTAPSSQTGVVQLTVIAYDRPGEFSWITGLLAAAGADILDGDVFTLTTGVAEATTGRNRGHRRPTRTRRLAPRPGTEAQAEKRRIIDVFEVRVPEPEHVEDLRTQLEAQLTDLLARSLRGDSPESIREQVGNRIATHLPALHEPPREALLPLDLQIQTTQDGRHTAISVKGQDTPAFLYCLSNALAASGAYVDSVRIRTTGTQVEDLFLVTDALGRAIDSRESQRRLRLAVIFTKQFTHFLGSAPDPFRALIHFQSLMAELPERLGRDDETLHLSDPRFLKDLARVLGSSEYLWEDFIRTQYENLVPLLTTGAETDERQSRVDYERRLRDRLQPANTVAEQIDVLNRFKDWEAFRIDLDHILDPAHEFAPLSARLTDLAEAVVTVAFELAFADLRERYGEPLNVAGRPCSCAVLGLGKLGGRELGYASDLELLVVYGDDGRTTSSPAIGAAEFFCRLVERLHEIVRAKRQGIFELDLRLRPHGSSGPLACSLESFCRYYPKSGPALDYERQALIKLRTIAGNAELGQRLEAFRDEILYHSRQVEYEAIDDLRRRQHRELAGGSVLNAKFSAGGLVDVEYAVQYLQILHGHEHEELRTPNTREALAALAALDLLPNQEAEGLLQAHAFLRRLVNAMRMLRGNAKDLEVPPLESLEFGHLARRMGYTSTSGRSAAERLRADLGGYMAYVRDFCRRRFGRSVLVSRDTGNLADVGLALDLDADTTREILERTGFENWERAAWNLRSLVAAGGDRDLLCQVVVLAEPLLRASADSDMALNNWERYIQKVISPRAFHESLLRRPQEMEIFLDIVAASQFLADVLIRNPEYFPWVLQPDNLLQHRSPQDFRSQILEETRAVTQADRVFDAIRRTRRRELLRIGTRDLCLGVPFEETVQDLSRLAAEVIRSVLLVEAGNIDGASQILGRGGLTVLAFGKLGAGELNYSSDVDLLAFLDGPGSTGADATEQEVATRLLQQAIHTLTTASQEGHLYRVDMRLRPFGSQGALVGSRDALVDYYRHKARPWEVQALLKAGAVVAQDPAKERDFLLERIRDGLRRWSASDLAADARRSRLAGRQRAAARRPGQTPRLDVKTGEGGIRDVEFAVQHLQLLYHNRGPELLVPATLPAIQKLVSHGVLDPEKGTTLEHNYLLLRRIEHLLQIMHDRQIHAMPTDDNSLQALCRRLNRDQDSPARLRRDVETALQTNLTFFDHTCTPGA